MRFVLPLCFAIVAMLACQPANGPPSPDASDAQAYDGANPEPGTEGAAHYCGELAALGCPEGVDATCVTVLQMAIDERLSAKMTDVCLSHATSVAAFRACGVACPGK